MKWDTMAPPDVSLVYGLVIVYLSGRNPVNDMLFKTMPKEVILKTLEGHENILSKAAEEQRQFFKRLSCPSCGGEVMAIVNARQIFKKGELLPNCLARCRTCEIEFEPYTGIQITLPTDY
jgi:hypothetical protein